jgi:hypothetical protein
MSGVIRQKAMLGQANGPDVELVVSGTKSYATYETAAGYPAIYDDGKGLFCYAELIDGEYRSTGVPVTSSPPGDAVPHALESDEVRARKIREHESRDTSRSRSVHIKE